jgi:hypothetical protein
VVVIVRVAVAAVGSVKAGRCWALDGLEVTAAVSATFPVKPPAGVTVMVELFPMVAPEETVTAVPLTVKAGLTAVVTDRDEV